MADWYKVERKSNLIRVTFVPSEHRYWNPEILRQQPLPAREWAGQEVEVTGPGSVWMYAYAAATLRAAGVAAIHIRSGGAVAQATDLSGSFARLQLTPAGSQPNRALFQMHLRKEPPLANEAILELLRAPLNDCPSCQELCITGKGSVLAYAFAAEQAVAKGSEWITCWTPGDGLVVAFDRQGEHTGERMDSPDWLIQLNPPPQHSLLLGVVGDPNLGKSVFSEALDSYQTQLDICGWRFDCDGQSPTPPWYLSLHRDQPDQARIAREAVKRSWTTEMEEEIANRLVRLRRFFSLVIADLPGGNHKISPPQRIPPRREGIFAQVDRLILLDRPDGSTEQAWREALRPHGLENRLVAVLRSSHPHKEPRLELFQEGTLWRGTVQGLDRSRPAREIAFGFGDSLRRLWSALVQRDREGSRNEA